MKPSSAWRFVRAQGADVERLVCKFGVWRLVWVRFWTHDGQRRGSFIFASPGLRCTFEMIHQSLSLFVAISGSGKSFAADGLYHSSWYGITLMTERFSSLLPQVNVEEQPREECIACRAMELVVSVFRFTAQSRRKHTFYDFLLSSMSERVIVGFTGRWLQDIAFVFSWSTFPARRWTADPEVILG